ncbi:MULTISPECIES: SDR family NAD(P)-dependent oxidoreductase [Kitasatospora]|uniref:SDR family oxidoreductase n=1 Tax=Kitasatospora cystarginea TaxID=58350 RepID=A0ABN3DEW7_9ACTN
MSDGYAVISGGSGHLGSAVAARLLAEGRRVVVLDRVPPRAQGAEFHQTDLADEQATDERLARLLELRGAPDGLVMCQGWSPKGPDGRPLPEAEVPAALFRQVLDANLTSCFLLMRTLVPAMAEAGRGRVVAVGSAAAHTGRTTAGAAYAAAKAGLAAMVSTFAVRHGGDGVLINTVAPGKVANPDWPDSAEEIDRYRREIPVGRLAHKEEVADLIAFLVSDRNSYLTGQTVIVDGGRLA